MMQGIPRNAFGDMQVDRYEEYPKMRELIHRKDSLVAQRATPAYFMQVIPFPHPRQQSPVLHKLTATCCWECDLSSGQASLKGGIL